MVRILVIQHENGVGPMRFGDWLEEAGAEIAIIRADLGERVPASLEGTGADGLLVLGGDQAPHADEENPWLPPTRALQRRLADAGVPSFNICLGGELVAIAHDAPIRRRSRPQVGIYELEKLPAAAEDPVFSAMPERAPALLWHEDEIAELPDGAVHLVGGTDAPLQAFRIGAACWATQFHPEVDAAAIADWVPVSDLPQQAGVTAEELVASIEDTADAVREAYAPVAHAFVAEVERSAAARALDADGAVDADGAAAV